MHSCQGDSFHPSAEQHGHIDISENKVKAKDKPRSSTNNNMRGKGSNCWGKQERMGEEEKKMLKKLTHVCAFNKQLRFPDQRAMAAPIYLRKGIRGGRRWGDPEADWGLQDSRCLNLPPISHSDLRLHHRLCSSYQCSAPWPRKLTVLPFSNHEILDKSFHGFRFHFPKFF